MAFWCENISEASQRQHVDMDPSPLKESMLLLLFFRCLFIGKQREQRKDSEADLESSQLYS